MKKKIARILALALTVTQCMSVPAAEMTVEPEDGWITEEDTGESSE